jgi:hypothetical protein
MTGSWQSRKPLEITAIIRRARAAPGDPWPFDMDELRVFGPELQYDAGPVRVFQTV